MKKSILGHFEFIPVSKEESERIKSQIKEGASNILVCQIDKEHDRIHPVDKENYET